MKRLLLALASLVVISSAQAQVVQVALPCATTCPAPTPSSFLAAEDPCCCPTETQAQCCQRQACIWGGAEYLLWWVKPGPTPPLVTTGNPNLPPPGVPGALGQPGTEVVFGNSPLNYGTFSGMRFTLGAWLNDDGNLGLEGSGFVLERKSVGFSAGSDAAGNPPIYVPFFNVASGHEGSLTIADPVFGFNGGVAVSSSSQLWGAEINGLAILLTDGCFSLTMVGGFRYLGLCESLGYVGNFNDHVFDVQQTYSEGFSTRNQFYGGQLGTRLSWNPGALGIDLTGKVALGSTHEVVNATGEINVSGTGAINPGTFPGGALFVQPSNMGRQSESSFSVVPQIQAKVSYQLLDGVRLTAGYDFLYWSDVVRPGDQIDRSVNVTQIAGGTLVGQPSPMPLFHHSDFIAHGVSMGLEFRY